MRSLQNYKDIYREIATNLNLQGDSVEMIVQLLSYASYIEETENIVYAQESSLEKATLLNSKIQLCMNEMYSVFRGQCPRVILNIVPQRYFSFQPFDVIVSSNNFKIYYLGYIAKDDVEYSNAPGMRSVMSDLGTGINCVYGGKTINPGESELTVIGLLAPDTVRMGWTLGEDNLYYVDCPETLLSNDMYATVNGLPVEVTRNFSEHVLRNYLFDLTLTSFGSRLYTGKMDPSTTIVGTYYRFSRLSEYNESELKKINIRGAKMTSFPDNKWQGVEELVPGVVLIDATVSDDLNTIHYKAYRDRFVNTIIRSNSDIGAVLEEMYPGKVGNTNYEFNYTTEQSDLTIYYVPKNIQDPLTQDEINRFIEERKAYYVTDQITVQPGEVYRAVISVDVELYENTSVDEEISTILLSYGKKFGVNLEEEKDGMITLISKISNVSRVSNLSITYIDQSGLSISADNISKIYENIDQTYFDISFVINSIVRTQSI